MSRYIFSSNFDSFDLMNNQKKITLSTTWATIRAYNKINFNSTICYNDGSNWIVGVGSFIYKSKSGEEALSMIISEFSVKKIPDLKKEIRGIYSFAIYKNEVVYFFNDYYGLFETIFGIVEEKGYFVGTNWADIIPNLPKCDINEFPFMLHCFAYGNFSNEGLVRGSFKLAGNEYLIAKKDKLEKIIIDESEYSISIPKFSDENQAINYLMSQIGDVVSDIKYCYGSSTLSITGGLDSRLVLGALTHESGNLNKLIYGESKSFLLSTHPEDKKIAQELSVLSNIPLNIYDWTNPEAKNGIDLEWQKKLFSEVGFFNTPYGGNRLFVETVTDPKNGPYIEFGYFLEAIRTRDWVDSKKGQTFSIDDYVNNVYSFLNKLPYDNKDSFIIWLKELFKTKTAKLGISNYDSIPLSMVNEIEWIFRERISDSGMHRFLNYYMYAFPIFSVPQIHEFIIKLPHEILKKGKFQISLIRALNPQLLECGVLSHRRKYKINKNNEKILRHNFKNIVSLLRYQMPWLYKIILSNYQSRKYRSTPNFNKAFIDEISSLKGDKYNFFDIGQYEGDVSSLLKFRQAILAFNYSAVNEE